RRAPRAERRPRVERWPWAARPGAPRPTVEGRGALRRALAREATHRDEARGRAGLRPRVRLAHPLRREEPVAERRAIEGVDDDACAHVVEADAVDEATRALAVVTFLPVELQERGDELDGLALGLPARELLRGAHREARASADIDVPTVVGHHEAEVFDGRLGAVPGAGRDAHLHLVRRPRRPSHLLDRDAE